MVAQEFVCGEQNTCGSGEELLARRGGRSGPCGRQGIDLFDQLCPLDDQRSFSLRIGEKVATEVAAGAKSNDCVLSERHLRCPPSGGIAARTETAVANDGVADTSEASESSEP